MAGGKSSTDAIHRQIAIWLLSLLVVCAAAVAAWWFTSDIVVAVIHAVEVILWLLGLLLWPFRL